MSMDVGIDKQYKSQPAPCRWGQTYRAARRNAAKINKTVWGSVFYSERHFNTFHKTKRP